MEGKCFAQVSCRLGVSINNLEGPLPTQGGCPYMDHVMGFWSNSANGSPQKRAGGIGKVGPLILPALSLLVTFSPLLSAGSRMLCPPTLRSGLSQSHTHRLLSPTRSFTNCPLIKLL